MYKNAALTQKSPHRDHSQVVSAELEHLLGRAVIFYLIVLFLIFLTLNQGSSDYMKTSALILSLWMTRTDSHDIA